MLELLLTKLRFAAATHAAAAAGEAGVEPLPDFTGQLQVGASLVLPASVSAPPFPPSHTLLHLHAPAAPVQPRQTVLAKATTTDQSDAPLIDGIGYYAACRL